MLVLVVGGVSLFFALHGAERAPVGEAAPGFTLAALQGGSISLSSERGHDVVLRFGSVSCTLCDPDWSELAAWQSSGGSRVRVIAIELGQPASVVQLATEGQDLTVPVLIDPTGAVAQSYGVHTVPTVAFIDEAGDLVSLQVVESRTGLWPLDTWRHYMALTEAADGGGSGTA